jgi:hypothetical protein
MKTVGYVRVSTDRQADKGVSLEAQEAKIRAMAIVRGADLDEVIVDGGESAKDLNRPGVKRLLALMNGGNMDAVIVAKLDRLTRRTPDRQRAGSSLRSCVRSVSGSAKRSVNVRAMPSGTSAAKACVLEISRSGTGWLPTASTSNRTRRSKRHLTKSAGYGGRAQPLRGIAAVLNHQAYRTRRGTPWRLESVARVFKQTESAH